MTVVGYALGKPPVAAMRGGDCRARDLAQQRNVYGPHRFAVPSDMSICNGLIRVTVGVAGNVPIVGLECVTPGVVGGVTTTTITDDYYTDYYQDFYPGTSTTTTSTGTAAVWTALGVLTIDSPVLSAVLTGARLVRVSPEAVTIRLVVPVIADVFITLRRGETMIRIQHGDTRGSTVLTTRRIRLTASPAPTGAALTGRVEESTAAIPGHRRFLAASDSASANASAFSIQSPAGYSYCRFGAGAASDATYDTTAHLHAQLSDASRPRLVVARV